MLCLASIVERETLEVRETSGRKGEDKIHATKWRQSSISGGVRASFSGEQIIYVPRLKRAVIVSKQMLYVIITPSV